MPTYEYACRSCGEHLEVVQSFRDDALTECPTCHGELRKVFSAAGIIFKGSGWHIKDYAGAGRATGTSDSSGASTESGGGTGEGSSGDSAAGGGPSSSEGSDKKAATSGDTTASGDGSGTGSAKDSGARGASTATSSTSAAPTAKTA